MCHVSCVGKSYPVMLVGVQRIIAVELAVAHLLWMPQGYVSLRNFSQCHGVLL